MDAGRWAVRWAHTGLYDGIAHRPLIYDTARACALMLVGERDLQVYRGALLPDRVTVAALKDEQKQPKFDHPTMQVLVVRHEERARVDQDMCCLASPKRNHETLAVTLKSVIHDTYIR